MGNVRKFDPVPVEVFIAVEDIHNAGTYVHEVTAPAGTTEDEVLRFMVRRDKLDMEKDAIQVIHRSKLERIGMKARDRRRKRHAG